MENTVASKTKKIYEDKIKTMSYVDSSKLIPLLIEVSRKKQGNEKLNWGNWLKIPENIYLLQINESIARKVFEDTNALIDRAISNINLPTQRPDLIESGRTSRVRGGDRQTTTIIYGLEFDGLTQHISTEFAGTQNEPQVDRTYSFWMKSSLTTKNQAVFGYGTHKKEGFTPNFSAGRPLFWGGQSWYTFWDDTPAQDDGQWHHWMIFNDVDDTCGFKMYVDGVLLPINNCNANSGTPGVHVQGLVIGGSKHNEYNNQHAECSLTNFAVFPGDKTANASAHYNGGIPKDLTNESDLEGYWKMDEGSGETVKDHSGNGNHGTIEWNNRLNGANDSRLNNCQPVCSDGGPSWITMMEVETVEE